MNPAYSVIVFTTVAGAAQGLVVALAVAVLAGVAVAPAFLGFALLAAIVLLVVGLGASFLHLGRPERAWRAAMMWRTSWLSREVIALPAFIGVVALWWLALRVDAGSLWTSLLFPLVAIAGAALLWYCTAMIYACLRFIEEWSHPLTLINYTLTGLASGLLLGTALATLAGEGAFAGVTGPSALVVTLVGWATRMLALRRNATLVPRSTLQSATGIASARLAQTSMGMSAGSFNTRVFFLRASAAALLRIKGIAIVLGFALPSLLVAGVAVGALPDFACVAAMVVQAPGLIADRWLFFAQAKHPQNLYYQVVS